MIDDGQWLYCIILLCYYCEKIYLVVLESLLVEGIVELFVKGVQLYNEKDFIKLVLLEVIILIEVCFIISEGCYYQVKCMFVVVGNYVVGLYWECIGDILLDELLVLGEYCLLMEVEIVSVGVLQLWSKM